MIGSEKFSGSSSGSDAYSETPMFFLKGAALKPYVLKQIWFER